MSEEIKEYLQESIDREQSCLLNSDNCEILLKHINNLQQRVEQLEKSLIYLEKYFSKREYYEFAELIREIKKADIKWLEKGIERYE